MKRTALFAWLALVLAFLFTPSARAQSNESSVEAPPDVPMVISGIDAPPALPSGFVTTKVGD